MHAMYMYKEETSTSSETYSMHHKKVGTTSRKSIFMKSQNYSCSRRNYLLQAESMLNIISWSLYTIHYKKL